MRNVKAAVIIKTDQNGEIAEINLPDGVAVFTHQEKPPENPPEVKYTFISVKSKGGKLRTSEYEIERENAEVDMIDAGHTIGELNELMRFVQKTGQPVSRETYFGQDEVCYLTVSLA